MILTVWITSLPYLDLFSFSWSDLNLIYHSCPKLGSSNTKLLPSILIHGHRATAWLFNSGKTKGFTTLCQVILLSLLIPWSHGPPVDPLILHSFIWFCFLTEKKCTAFICQFNMYGGPQWLEMLLYWLVWPPDMHTIRDWIDCVTGQCQCHPRHCSYMNLYFFQWIVIFLWRKLLPLHLTFPLMQY